MLSYPSDGAGSLLTWARYYHSLGMVPLPADSLSNRPKKPLVEFGQLRDERPSWDDVRSLFFSRPSADSLGLLLPIGVAVVDCDGPEGEAWLSDRFLPPDCPRARTRRGFHSWVSAPPVFAGKVKVAPSVDVLGAGHFCLVQPSPDKVWERPLALPLPAAPPWLVEVAESAVGSHQSATQAGAERDEAALSEQLARYRDLLPDMEWEGDKGSARCPFHDDGTPSFSVYMREGVGNRLYWRCHAECEDTFVGRRRGRARHGGNLNDLLRLFRRLNCTGEYDRARRLIASLTCSTHARALLEAIVNVAEERDLGLGCEVGLSYRAIARATGCEAVVITAKYPKGYLSKTGRVVRVVIEEAAELGVGVIRGSQYTPENGRGLRTAFVIPRKWYQGD